jgi:hypothetical protein
LIGVHLGMKIGTNGGPGCVPSDKGPGEEREEVSQMIQNGATTTV